MMHWKVRLSSPDAEQRGQAGDISSRRSATPTPSAASPCCSCRQGRRRRGDARPGLGAFDRADPRGAPAGRRLGVRILVENVWNGFCETPRRSSVTTSTRSIAPGSAPISTSATSASSAPSEDWIRTLGTPDRQARRQGLAAGRSPVVQDRRRRCKLARGSQGPRRDRLQRLVDGRSGAAGGRERLADIAARMDLQLGLA